VFGTVWILQSWATNLLSGLAGALVGGILSYFGGVRGARIAAQTAIALQKEEFAKREEAAKLTDQALIRGTVQAISDEIEALWLLYYREIGPHLASVGETEAARAFPVHQSYFVVFDANGGLVGRIPSASLSRKILNFYVGAKSMIDSLQYYASLSGYYFTLEPSHPKAVPTFREMLFYTGQLRGAHLELERRYSELKPELDAYLKSTPSDQSVYLQSVGPRNST
jgi:hypothetical protein